MLKNGEINPLNVWGLREVKHIPPHFSIVPIENSRPLATQNGVTSRTNSTGNYINTFSLPGIQRRYKDWIFENLSGRFYVGLFIDENRITKLVAAFEEPGEASFFALLKDQI